MTKLSIVALTAAAGLSFYGCVFIPIAVSGVIGPLEHHPLIAVNDGHTPSPSPTPSPSASPSPSPSGSASPSPSGSASASPSPTPSASASVGSLL